MADNKEGGSPQEEAIMSRLKQAPGHAPVGVTTYIGLLGRSQKEGYWLLYLTLDMSQWVEINEADIVHSEQLPPERSPFGSLGGTQVFVKQNASLITSKTVSKTHAANEPPDDFDLDVQLGGGVSAPAISLGTTIGNIPRGTCDTCRTQCDTCPGDTCITCGGTCHTACGTCVTCATCQTHCNQATCAATCQTCQTQCNQNTCVQTQCNQNTCHTCQTQCNQNTCAQTQCNQATCHTCQTLCNQATCNTCRTRCDTCVTCRTCDTCHPPRFCQ